jgi:hypothetical protein
MKQQTAVEWLFSQIKKDIIGLEYDYADELEQAKEMEKEHMIEFAWECQEMFKHEIKEHFEEKFNDGGNK